MATNNWLSFNCTGTTGSSVKRDGFFRSALRRDRTCPKPGADCLGIFDDQQDVTRRLRAMWALHVIGELEETWLLRQLDNDNESLRSWAVRLLCEDEKPSNKAVEKFAVLAASDRSALVRLHIASVLQRMPLEQRWDIAAGLVAHGEDDTDQNLPLMIWYGIEPAVAADQKMALELAAKTKISKVRRFIARRIASSK